VNQSFQRRSHQFLERLAMAIRQRLARRLIRKSQRQPLVIVQTGVVVPRRSQVDQPFQRLGHRHQCAAAQIVRGSQYIHIFGRGAHTLNGRSMARRIAAQRFQHRRI